MKKRRDKFAFIIIASLVFAFEPFYSFAACGGGGGGGGGGGFALAGTLINSIYDENARVTHCTYSAMTSTYTIEIGGFASCPPTTPAPRG